MTNTIIDYSLVILIAMLLVLVIITVPFIVVYLFHKPKIKSYHESRQQFEQKYYWNEEWKDLWPLPTKWKDKHIIRWSPHTCIIANDAEREWEIDTLKVLPDGHIIKTIITLERKEQEQYKRLEEKVRQIEKEAMSEESRDSWTTAVRSAFKEI